MEGGARNDRNGKINLTFGGMCGKFYLRQLEICYFGRENMAKDYYAGFDKYCKNDSILKGDLKSGNDAIREMAYPNAAFRFIKYRHAKTVRAVKLYTLVTIAFGLVFWGSLRSQKPIAEDAGAIAFVFSAAGAVRTIRKLQDKEGYNEEMNTLLAKRLKGYIDEIGYVDGANKMGFELFDYTNPEVAVEEMLNNPGQIVGAFKQEMDQNKARAFLDGYKKGKFSQRLIEFVRWGIEATNEGITPIGLFDRNQPTRFDWLLNNRKFIAELPEECIDLVNAAKPLLEGYEEGKRIWLEQSRGFGKR